MLPGVGCASRWGDFCHLLLHETPGMEAETTPNAAEPGFAEGDAGLVLRPKLDGDRFREHAIPLGMLKDLAALEDLLLETAKQEFRDEHDRSNVSGGFTRETRFELRGVGEGSAVPEIRIRFLGESASLFAGDPKREAFRAAVRSVFDAVQAAAEGRLSAIADHLRPRLLTYFNRVGAGLLPGESWTFENDLGEKTSLTPAIREELLLASSVSSLTKPLLLYGTVQEADSKQMTFRLHLTPRGRFTVPLPEPFYDEVMEAQREWKVGRFAVCRLEGLGRFARSGKLTGVESVSSIARVDELDPGAQLDAMKAIRDGWLDGAGKAPPADGLGWLSGCFDRFYNEPSPPPYLYPTEAGGVQAEWTIGRMEAELVVDLRERAGAWLSFDPEDETREVAERLDLRGLDGWERLATLLQDARGAGAPS